MLHLLMILNLYCQLYITMGYSVNTLMWARYYHANKNSFCNTISLRLILVFVWLNDLLFWKMNKMEFNYFFRFAKNIKLVRTAPITIHHMHQESVTIVSRDIIDYRKLIKLECLCIFWVKQNVWNFKNINSFQRWSVLLDGFSKYIYLSCHGF